MVKFNSTIFRTIKDEATGANQSIGLFGKSFGELKTVLSSVKANGLFKTSTLNESDIKIIEKYNDLINAGVTDQVELEQATKGASVTTAQMIKNANGNTIALDKMTLGAKAASVGLKALSVAGNMFLGMAISWGVSKLVKGITELAQAKEKARQAAIEAINAYKEEQSLLEDQIKNYKKVSEALKNENLSVDEILQKKEELLGIQNNLIDTYGNEVKGIDLVNGKYKEQLELLENISQQNASNIIAENITQFEKAKEALDEENEYRIGKVASWYNYGSKTGIDDGKKLIEFIDGYSDLFNLQKAVGTPGSKLQTKYYLSVQANVEDADKVLRDFAKDLRDFGNENGIDVTSILKNIDKQLDKTWTKELEDYKKIYDEYSNAIIMSDDELRSMYEQSIIAVQNYNKTISSGEGYDEAKNNLENIKLAVKELTSDIKDGEDAWKVFQAIFDKEEESREQKIQRIKMMLDPSRVDRDLQLFFEQNPNVNLDEFERIATAYGNASAAIREYNKETQDEPSLISQKALDSAKEYRDELNKLYNTLALLRSGEVTASDIYGFVEEFPGLSEYVGDLELLEEKIQELVNERLVSLREQFNGVIDEETLKALSEYSVKAEGISSAIDSTADSIKNASDDFKSLNESIDFYNQNGYITLDMLEDLMKMEPQRLAMFMNEKNAIEEDTDAYKRYIKLRLDWYKQEAAMESQATKKKLEKDFQNGDITWEKRVAGWEAANEAYRIKTQFVTDTWNSINNGEYDGGISSSSTSSTFDWIEVKINHIKEVIEELKETAEDPFASWTERGSALQSIITELENSKNVYQQAYDAYVSEMNKVGLDQSYIDLIAGEEDKFEIDTFKDDPNYDKIQKYQELYEKALESRKLADGTGDELHSSIQDKFDLIASEFDAKLSHYENAANMIEAQLANAESKGYIATKQYYETLKSIEEVKSVELNNQLNDLVSTLEESGLKPDTEGWSELENKIEETELALQESTNAVQDFNNEIRQIDWDLFDFAREQESKLMDEADFMIDLLDSAKMFSEAGEITAEGMATMGLHAQNYNAYLEQSIDYANELARLQEEELSENPYDTDALERYNLMLEKRQESILSVEAEKEAIIDLVSEGIEKQKEALQSLLDQRMKELKIEQDIYDQQRRTAKSTKEIANLRKLISSTDTTADEGRAQVQKWKLQLEEKESDFESQQFDDYIQQQREIFETISEDYEKSLDAYLDDTNRVITDSFNTANKNAINIGKTLGDKAEEAGYEVSNEMNNIWTKKNGVLATGFQGVADNVNTGNGTLTEIKNENNDLIKDQKDAIVGELQGLTGTNSPLSHLSGIESVLETISTQIGGIKTGGSNVSGGETNPDPTPQPQPMGGGNTGSSGVNFEKKISDYKGKLNKDSSVVDFLKSYNIDSSDSARADYYKQMGLEDIYGKFNPNDSTQNIAMLNWLKENEDKIKGYASGGFNLKKQMAWTQENGDLEYIIRKSDGAILTRVNPGDMVLNSEASKNLWSVANNPASFFADIVKGGLVVDIPSSTSNGNMVQIDNLAINVPLENVTDVNSFLREFQRNPKVEAVIKDVIASSMTGNNSLSKYRHQF